MYVCMIQGRGITLFSDSIECKLLRLYFIALIWVPPSLVSSSTTSMIVENLPIFWLSDGSVIQEMTFSGGRRGGEETNR